MRVNDVLDSFSNYSLLKIVLPFLKLWNHASLRFWGKGMIQMKRNGPN